VAVISLSLPESEGPIRRWLQENTMISSLIGERVYFSMPQQDAPTLPCIVTYRVGGLPDEFMQDYPDMVIECWGATKYAASTLARVVASEILLSQSRPPVIFDGVAVVMGSVNFGPLPSGGNTKARRYRVDTTFHLRRVTG
jgi:hypothetical protein